MPRFFRFVSFCLGCVDKYIGAHLFPCFSVRSLFTNRKSLPVSIFHIVGRLIFVREIHFWGSFLIRVVFPLVIYSCKHLFILIASLLWMEVINQNPCIYQGQEFSCLVFFEYVSEWLNVYIRFRAFFDILQFFFLIVYQFGFFFMIPPFPYFVQKSF